MHWFHPPQLRIGEGFEEESRRATWLELFYDLVFVVSVSRVAHYLNEHVSLLGVLGFVLLFIPLWWAWIGATLYANRFDVDDVGHRLLAAVQMLGVAAMAVNIDHGLTDRSTGFALSYVLVRLVLVFQYLRAAHHLPAARALAQRYAIGFALAAGLWAIAVLVPAPWKFGLWALGIGIDLVTPLTAMRWQSKLLPHLEHLPERFGLFVIIVLGEAIIAVVNGISEMQWDVQSVLTAIFGFAIAFSLWWIYFENVDGSVLRASRATGQVQILLFWLYIHLPLVMGIAATGVAVEHLIVRGNDPAALATADIGIGPLNAEYGLLCGAVAVCLVALSFLHRTGVIFRCKARARYRLRSAIGLLLLALVGGQVPSVIMIGMVAIVMMTQVAQDVYQGHPTVVEEHAP